MKPETNGKLSLSAVGVIILLSNLQEESEMDLQKLKEQAASITEEAVRLGKIKAGDLFVVGCSSSAVQGEMLGSHSSMDIAEAVFDGVYGVLEPKGIYLAAQCCEHLGRALIVEREAAEKFDLERVNVIPQPKAGGSFGTNAYKHFKEPWAVESVYQKALGGIDIGGVLIGMHIKPVVVPLHLSEHTIGEANVTGGRYRPKFVGGERAVYDEELMEPGK